MPRSSAPALSSPGNSYFESSSRTSISTSSSSSGSSTMSALFRNTTMYGTSTWRARRMCSRGRGIGPAERVVLALLRHRAVSGRDHEDRAVHLGGARDHVLDVVGVGAGVYDRLK